MQTVTLIFITLSSKFFRRMKSSFDFDVETDLLLEEEIDAAKSRSIILYNDDYNTFDFVIESLIKVCRHDVIQAEQCTHIVGKCEVKKGTLTELKPMKDALVERGLSAVIN
jgi:ATP-dependent Clp protease adaptor protein ClpS